MPRLLVTTRDGVEHVVSARQERTLMHALRDSGLDTVIALCGGCRSCATCHIYVEPAFAATLPTMGPEENDLLDTSEHRTEYSRLSCQIPLGTVPEGLKVRIPPEE